MVYVLYWSDGQTGWSRDIEEGSKFHQSFLLISDIQNYFYFVKTSVGE